MKELKKKKKSGKDFSSSNSADKDYRTIGLLDIYIWS
jgi:hypothetical protein